MKISQAVKLCLEYHEADSPQKYDHMVPVHSFQISI
jgi:hypothetical protein